MSRTQMVALGNNRNNGLNLGSFYVNANNALSNSNGNNWRSRLTLFVTVARRRFGVRTESATPLKAVDRMGRLHGRSVRAVKYVHTRSVSRSARPIRRGMAQQGKAM